MNYEAALFYKHQEQPKLENMSHAENNELSAAQDPPSFGSIKLVSVSFFIYFSFVKIHIVKRNHKNM